MIKVNDNLYINENYIVSIVYEQNRWIIYMRNDINYHLSKEEVNKLIDNLQRKDLQNSKADI